MKYFLEMKFVRIFAIIISLLVFIPCGYSGVAHSKLESKEENIEGLYDANDKVISLTGSNLKKQILEQRYATLLEFYNSYCGHCRRFAPIYKQIAIDLWSWRDILKVMAIDCAADENNDVCRDYEVMAYPTLRYFPPHYKDGDGQLGININGRHPDFIKTFIIKTLVNETNIDELWPNFITLNSGVKNLVEETPEDIQYVFIIYEPENSTIAAKVALDLSRVKEIRIRRVTSPKIANGYNIETFNMIAVVDHNSNIDVISVANAGAENFRNVISQFLKGKNINIKNEDAGITTDEDAIKKLSTIKEKNAAILAEVKKNKHVVYQSDIEHALRYSLFHEITRFSEINGEKLLALQRFINVVVRYNPLGENGEKLLQGLQEFISSHNQEINGEAIQNELINLEKEFSPIFSSSHWIGCLPSKPGLRGFTCGLWQLFHFMTVQASENEKSTDPLEVLQAMHGYIKYFFGCSDCSNHFQAMSSKNKIWNTSSKDNAVLWLWSAHNEVNKRLSADETEDPEFPKIQFPSHDSCPECYKEPSTSPIISVSNDVNWDRTEVLSFLKRIYNPQNISRYGIDDENVLPPTAEKLHGKRLLGNVFSDLDMRMGIFLYIFCIGMMVIAVKLFLKKGYRKKTYTHDFLGKV